MQGPVFVGGQRTPLSQRLRTGGRGLEFLCGWTEDTWGLGVGVPLVIAGPIVC